jgi:hypothetical protein
MRRSWPILGRLITGSFLSLNTRRVFLATFVMADSRRRGCNRPHPLHLLKLVAVVLHMVSRADEVSVFPKLIVLFLFKMVTQQPTAGLLGLDSQSLGVHLVSFSTFQSESPIPHKMLNKAFKFHGQELHDSSAQPHLELLTSSQSLG